jgi:glycosyltransferase involved in cell wall biosynthesis
MPAVSVIVPAFNSAAFLDEALWSALRQTFDDLEIIVVDDGSSDDTGAIARDWAARDGRVRVLSNDRPHGTAGARNRALTEARGRFVALLDSDDMWEPAYLATALSVFDQFPDAAIVSGNVFNLGGPAHGRPYWPVDGGRRRVTLLDIIEHETAVCIMAIFRRQVLETIGPFDASLLRNEDYDFWLRAAAAGFAIVRFAEPLAWYRRRANSVSADELKMIHGIMTVLEKALSLCSKRPVERAAIVRQLRRFHREELVIEGKLALRAGRFIEAADCFESVYRSNPGVSGAIVAAASRYAPNALLAVDRLRRSLRTRFFRGPSKPLSAS